MQCAGRFAKKTDPAFFDAGPRLHRNKPLLFLLPIRCERSSDAELCTACEERCKATDIQLKKREGKYIPNQESLFHGKITEPIPVWSRLYKGMWWLAQIEAGYSISKETEEKAEEAYKKTYKDESISLDMSEPIPKPRAKKPRAKKAEPVHEPVNEPVHEPVHEPAPEPIKKPRAKKGDPKPRANTKKATPLGAITNLEPIQAQNIVHIQVKKTEIGGRAVLLQNNKDKVYDMKFNYLGRFNRETDSIDGQYPNSDLDA